MSNRIDRWLTAYVDGELTPDEARTVADLLREHPGLEIMLRRMEEDSARLKGLSRQSLAADFSDAVLAEIGRRNLGIRHRRPLIVRYLAPLAAAAAILIALGLLGRHLLNNHGGKPELARTQEENRQPVDGEKVAVIPGPRLEPSEAWDRIVAGLPSMEAAMQTIAPYRDMLAELGDVFRVQSAQIAAAVRTTPEDAEAAESPFATPSILTFPPAGKTDVFKTIQVRLPLFLDVRSLDSNKLLERLREESVHHLDLPCVESWKALERFQNAGRVAGVKVVLDAEAARRLNGKLPAMYLVYLENVAPETVGKLMQALQAEDSAAERRQKGDAQFRSLMVQSLDEDGRKRLAETLGVQPAKPAVGAPAAVDPGKPISNETLKSLQKAASGRPNGKPSEATAQAIVVVWHPRLRSTLSKEVRDLLDDKKPAQADGINVVFLFRPSRG